MTEQLEQPWYARAGFSDEQWGLLVGLPQTVLVAASSVEPDGGRRTAAENAAGLHAIAAGRESGSPLVEAVAAEVVSRVGEPEPGSEPPVIEPSEPGAVAAEALHRARAAAALLVGKVDEGEAGAYKHWLVSIAEEAVTATPSGIVVGLGEETVSPSERRFRDELARVLDD